MKIVRREDTKQHKNSDTCIATEYPLGDKDINGAVVELKGRYPEQGRVVNTECKEMTCVISGVGKVIIEGEEATLSQGDLLLLEPNEKYYWEGSMTLFVSCTPAWSPEQHQEVE